MGNEEYFFGIGFGVVAFLAFVPITLVGGIIEIALRLTDDGDVYNGHENQYIAGFQRFNEVATYVLALFFLFAFTVGIML